MAVTGDLSRYRYISTLGTGGMARVDLAEDTLLGRHVALKRMSEATDPVGLSRLRREALIGASLSHPNVVSIFDVVETDDAHFVLVMEYVAGETLRARIRRQGKLPVPEALSILEGVAAGLDAIHARGIVHRDIKPSNILLGADGVVKVADLGIASVPDQTRITTSGSILGSLSYMAPEQLENVRASRAIDIYALAAVAFETLSGKKARRESNAVALAHALATQPPPDLRAAWPEAPAAAAEVLSRGMSRDPKARPRSGGELVARLKEALEPERTAPMRAPVAAPVPLAAVAASRAAAPAPRRAAPPARAVAAVRESAPSRRPADGGEVRRPASPPPVRVIRAGHERRTRAAAVAATLLGLVALAVVLAVVLNSGGARHTQSTPNAAAARHAGAATTHKKAATPHSATTASSAPSIASTGSSSSSHGAPSSAGSGSGSNSSSASGSGSGSGARAGAATPAATQSTSAGAGSTGASTAAAGTPVAAVESFYHLAASHQYSAAWALADPSLRAQLRGYPSFMAGQAGDRSITFNGARTVTQSTSGATVAIETTSVRDDGTHRCTGTVNLVPSGSASGWLLDRVNINCTA